MGVSMSSISIRAMSVKQPSELKTATLAMGCFWHPDALFGCQKGVYRTRVGYTGGTLENPTYRNLGDHTESVDIDYDPEVTNYEKLLQLFWEDHDPAVQYRRQYRSAIFYRDEDQKKLAEESKEEKETVIGKPIATSIEPVTKFYNAEDYHQKYFLQTHHEQLFKSLGIKQKDLVDSSIAAKLNGYVVGLNSLESFEADCQSLGLSPEYAAYVRKVIARGKQSHCGT